MKLKEAIPKMDVGDKFVFAARFSEEKNSGYFLKIKRKDWSGNHVFVNSGGGEVTGGLMASCINIEGEIIPAKPKILSASDFTDIVADKKFDNATWEELQGVVKDIDKNGQLRAYYEHGFKELVEYCSDTILAGNVWQTDVLENLIQNIKKPE